MEDLIMTHIEIPLRLLAYLWLVESVDSAMTLDSCTCSSGWENHLPGDVFLSSSEV